MGGILPTADHGREESKKSRLLYCLSVDNCVFSLSRASPNHFLRASPLFRAYTNVDVDAENMGSGALIDILLCVFLILTFSRCALSANNNVFVIPSVRS